MKENLFTQCERLKTGVQLNNTLSVSACQQAIQDQVNAVFLHYECSLLM